MTDRWRVYANLATLANAVLGVGAILYVLAGNKLWAMLLIACAIGFDGWDGVLSRRSSSPAGRFGRVADSVADAVSFGVAPAFLIAVHTGDTATWQPWEPVALGLAVVYLAAALARLTYFTARAYNRPYFLGVPTPESALALIVALLFHDTPAFQTVQPVGVFIGVAVLSVMMVVPVPYPKVRRGSPLRIPMAATAVVAALALVPLQFHLATGSFLYNLAYAASVALLVGVAVYYIGGPFTVSQLPAKDRPAP
ncbi:MAG TPA: CDP-alcohol phosphatidyltransferase family protein [Thermoplasmata archaeon]|nr:CDP-alcohol phosphatidyltransferase family protein [Thermoplasmata archaeon]